MENAIAKFTELASGFGEYMVKTAHREEIARKFLHTPEDRCATSLYMCVRTLYGSEVSDWEPETLWVTMAKDGFDLPEETRNKLQCVLTMHKNPAFYWDNIVFQWTVQALNDELYDSDSIQECHPAHMAWAVYEAGVIRALDPDDKSIPELDEDVQQYIALCLKRAGYVYVPDSLKPVADNLERMFPAEQKEFIAQVKNSWVHLDKRILRDRVFPEDALGIQLAQLASCYEYVKDRANSMASDVLSIEKAILT
jgi:hypothetical protein